MPFSPGAEEPPIARSSQSPRGARAGEPQPSIGLQDGDRVDRHTDPTLQAERPDDKEKLICPILGQLVEVEDLDDISASVPDEVYVQWQAEKAECFPRVIGFYRETPFYRCIVGTDRDDLHVVQELQAIGADARLRLMPFGVRSVETPGIVRFRPRLPPPGANQQNVALSKLDVLRLRRILQVLDSDPIIARQRVSAFVSGDVEQHAAPDHLNNARRISLHRASRLWRRHVVEESVLAKDVPEGVEMRTRMVVHKGEAGGPLLTLRVEFPRFRRDTIIPVVLLNNLDADTLRSDHSRDIGIELLAERIDLPLLHECGGLRNHLGGDVIEHAAFVVLAPAPPVAALAPFARHRPGRRFIG